MWRFLAYLSKSFVITWLTVVFGFLVLIGLLDSLANGGDILSDEGTFVDTFRYMSYRAPVIFDRIFVFTIHVAVLLTFVKLIRNHELVALLGFGVSTLKQMALLTPAVVGVSILSVVIINIAMPIEGADGEPRLALKASGPQLWKTTQTPQSIARLAAEPRDIALSDMRGFMQKGNSGSKPSFAYQFWYWHRITRPIAAFILLLCAAPIMQRTGRQDTGDKALIIGITLGFIFLIMDGAMATFAASGGVGTLYAITFPLVLFALGGLFMLLRTESLT